MTDYKKTSREIDAGLKAQGITIEVDEFAPCIMECPECKAAAVCIPRGNPLSPGIACRNTKHRQPCFYIIVCPFFGPGGADNSLKALRAYCKKYDCYLAIEDAPHEVAKWLLISEETVEVDGDPQEPPQPEPALCLDSEGKTDGEALRDLLYKLMEEKK